MKVLGCWTQDVLRDGDMLWVRPAQGRLGISMRKAAWPRRKPKQKALPAPAVPAPALLALPAPAVQKLPEALESSWITLRLKMLEMLAWQMKRIEKN